MPISEPTVTSINGLAKPQASLVSTTCPYCGVGCGIDVVVKQGEQAEKPGSLQLSQLSGSSDHPANFGRLCVKGSKLLETNSNVGRLANPKIMGKNADWPSAINKVATTFSDIIAKHGPDAVAFYVSGQLLTEDYYVANKLMKGYIGSANIDTNSRLCMSSAVAAYKRAFGADAVPCCYEDLELCDVLVLVGSNAAWTHPVLFQRIERAKQRNPELKVISIDPRITATSELADLHLAIKPGTDVALFNGLLAYLAANNGLDQNYITQFTQGFEQALSQSQQWTISNVAELCDIETQELKTFYQTFCQADKAVTAYTMGVNQSTRGVDKANAIINCHLASGKLGREGCGPFSLTGQPNAMGGREVGGLANMLASHMDLDNPIHRDIVQNYWQSPTIANKAGFKAVDLFDEINKGKVKAVWIMATNPVVSMPNRDKIINALKKCELVVVSDCVASNDTIELAHVVLPATGWSEKDGTVTNSERRISRQRGILEPYGESKHDWQILCEVANAMGFAQGFNYSQVDEIFREYAGLSGAQNNGQRDLDLSALATLTVQQYQRLSPLQWPVNQQNPQGTKRLFTDGRFYTQSGKAQFIPLTYHAPEQLTTVDYPFVLNSGRIRDQWHTMTRTGKTAELTSHISKPYVAMHPQDATRLSLQEGALIKLSASHSNEQSAVVLMVTIDDKQRKGELFAPMHWSAMNSSHGAITSLFTDANDKISGQPELKHAAVALEPVNFNLQGELFIKHLPSMTVLRQCFEFFVISPFAQGHKVSFATNNSIAAIKYDLQLNLPRYDEWVSALNPHQESFNARSDGNFSLALFAAKQSPGIDDSWISHLMEQVELKPEELNALLAGVPDAAFSAGPLVCSCFKVGKNTINEAIAGGCSSVEELGLSLKCGTNCGSCKSELSQMIKQHQLMQPKKSKTLVAEQGIPLVQLA
ncbi:nitrate reductase [Paraglaciecola hydrolytica]|uniref:Nitrate reductase n=1 Tax=Paraglaciecola hydrolytica TaxID=1799789 RepID=A0A136A627_9ALTE|nr:nitrate reductase [Paraglaciecola hydrolytica]KXI30682.1 nitrate reductase [Paraglaciecola hydrolytica]